MKQLVSGKTETGYERFPSIIYRMVKIRYMKETVYFQNRAGAGET